MPIPKIRLPWPGRDILIMAGVVLITLLLLGLQCLMEWTAAMGEASRRFRDHKDNFYRSFQQHLDQSRGDGARLTLAMRPDGTLDRAVFDRICRQLDGATWARVELIVLQGHDQGRWQCGSSQVEPLDAALRQTAQQLAKVSQPQLGPGSTRQAQRGQAPVLEWLYPLAHPAGAPLPGFARLHYRLQSGIDAAIRSQPDHGEYALDEGNPLVPDERNDAYPPAPLLQSPHWPPGRYSMDIVPEMQLNPPWITHWDNLDYTTSDGQPYRLTLFARSRVAPWFEWADGSLPVLVFSSLLAMIVIGLTLVLLQARRRLRRVVESRGRRLARRARELKQVRDEQQLLEAALLDTSEREKQRLGSELHDGAGQSLTAARLLADSLAHTLQPVPPALTALQTSLQQAINEIRLGARGMTPAPLLEGGLPQALQALASQHAGSRVQVSVSVDGKPPQLTPEGNLHVYRIAQEAVSNAIRHGQASQIALTLGDAPLLIVKDNGGGFDPATVSQGIGLRSQQLRAGLLGRQLTLDATPGAGVKLCLA